MILTDDNFATIVKAVELGRGLYDNLTKYIRFQMGVLVGFIVTFLGASIFNVVGGVPFVPLQTLYVNFTTQVLQSIGLGYGRPAEGLMKRKPRAVGRADPAAAAPDLGRDRRARDRRSDARADRLGRRPLQLEPARAHDGPDLVRVQQRLLRVLHARRAALGVLARRARGPDVPALQRAARSPRSCSAPSSGFLQRILGTVHLDLHQWLICIVVGLAIVPVSEGRRAPARAAGTSRGASRLRGGTRMRRLRGLLPVTAWLPALRPLVASRRHRRRHRRHRSRRPEEPRLCGHRRRPARERALRSGRRRPRLRALLHLAAHLDRAVVVARRGGGRRGARDRARRQGRGRSSSPRSRS